MQCLTEKQELLSNVLEAEVNADWRLKPGVYHYEGQDATTYDLPFPYVQVLTLKKRRQQRYSNSNQMV